MPKIALTVEPSNVPTFPAVSRSPSRAEADAREAAGSDHGPPIHPARQPGQTEFHRRPAKGHDAQRFAQHQADHDRDGNGLPISGKSIFTPAFARANSGMIPNATQG